MTREIEMHIAQVKKAGTSPTDPVLRIESYERRSGVLHLKPFKKYKTWISGRQDSSYDEVRFIDRAGNSLQFVTTNDDGEAVMMDSYGIKDVLDNACWVKTPDGKFQIFRRFKENPYLSKGDPRGIVDPSGHDIFLRDMNKSNIYFYGAKLYLLDGKERIPATQVGFGSDAGTHTFHFLNKGVLEKSGGSIGRFTKERLIEMLSGKDKKWGWIDIDNLGKISN